MRWTSWEIGERRLDVLSQHLRNVQFIKSFDYLLLSLAMAVELSELDSADS